jgi:5-methylcytosine-specific restriction enzyme A
MVGGVEIGVDVDCQGTKVESVMASALFINGIYEAVLTDILSAQAEGVSESFLQPYKGQVVSMLTENPPSPDHPVRLYLSTTERLSNICYTAEIVKWEDKREITASRRQEVLQHLERYQLKECGLFRGQELGEGKAVNLITIRNLRGLETLPPTRLLVKRSDGQPLKRRTRAGGWSEVFDRGDLEVFTLASTETEDSSNLRLANEIATARTLDADALQRRLESAPRQPERVQIVSIGYRRNADVIVAVLNRADGFCELCRNPAPFTRRADETPYLEVHHRVPPAEGGEDSVENALALCPNCHREAHYG